MGVVFITHDLGIVAGMCDRVVVMYAGHIVETGPTPALFETPRHPYTGGLHKSLPAIQQRGAPLYTIPGNPPDMTEQTSGCPFLPRCARAAAECGAAPMHLEPVGQDQWTACIRRQCP